MSENQPAGSSASAAATSGSGDQPDLETENAQLRAQLDQYQKREHGWSRARKFFSRLLAVIAVIGIIASSIAVWTRATLLDSDEWAATVGPLVENETIANAVGEELSAGVLELIDVEDGLAEVLGDEAEILAAPIASALQGFLGDEAAKLIQTDVFVNLWTEANRVAHEAAVKAIQGTESATNEDGQVVIDFVPLIVSLIGDVGEQVASFLPEDIELPDPSEVDRDEVVAQIEDTFDVTVPPDFGTVVVYESDVLPQVQDALRWLDRGTVLIVILTLAAIIGAIALAQDRLRLVRFMTGGVLLLCVILWLLREPIGSSILDSVEEGQPRDVAGEALSIVFSGLRTTLLWVGILAAVIWLGAYLAGSSERAVAFRTWVRDKLSNLNDDQPLIDPEGATAVFVRRHRGALGVAGVVVALLVVTSLNQVTWLAFLLVLVVLAAYFAGLELLARNEPESEPASGSEAAST